MRFHLENIVEIFYRIFCFNFINDMRASVYYLFEHCNSRPLLQCSLEIFSNT